jgi:transcription elongation factor Elf1
MLYIDAKYVGIISYKLRNFKQKADNYWNFSCPICGDSKKNPLKARGFVFKNDNRLVYKCHNCGFSSNIGNLIKHLDPTLYSEYVMERYKENSSSHNDHVKLEEVIDVPFLNKADTNELIKAGAQVISNLPLTHPALQYVVKRKIPREAWDVLYFVPKFKEFTNKLKYTFPKPDNDTPRLVIPYYKDGKCIAFQGRAFGKDIPKYITIKLDENEEKIYGLDRLDMNKKIYIVEGPIDSLFLPNAIAVSGAGFDTPFVRSLKDKAVLVMDNEPRSTEITKFISKYIDLGYEVCMFPDTMLEKDINEMITSGKTTEQIIDIIDNNTFSGIEARLKFTQWRKC